MFGAQKKIRDSVTGLVGQDEDVLAVVPVQPKGSGNARAVGGLAGAAIAGRGSKKNRESSAATGVDLASFGALAVTSRRVLFLKVGPMGTKATEISGEFALADVRSIDVGKSAMGLRKHITVTTGGGAFELETHWKAPAQDLSTALDRARAGNDHGR